MPILEDERGSFQEVFRNSLMPWIKPVQWNVSRSKANVVRGMHFQKEKPQAKYITVLEGHIVDVIIDLRSNQLDSVNLFPDGNCLYVPHYCAHGFWAKEPSVVLYGVDSEWMPSDEHGISPLDPDFDFPWKERYDLVISYRDRQW